MPAALDPIYSVDIGVCVVGPGIKKARHFSRGEPFHARYSHILGKDATPDCRYSLQ